MFIWWAVPHPVVPRFAVSPGTVVTVGDEVLVAAYKGWLKLVEIEIMGLKLKGRDIYGYFRERRGVVLI